MKENLSESSDIGTRDDVTETLSDIGLSFLLGALILCTVIGNVFVIIAILTEKNLRTVGNYLVLSLAIADLMVACLVMPLGAVYIVNGGWNLGSELCGLWSSADVLCCTASILHLLAIAIDRYWAVTNIDYIHNRSPKRIGILIVTIWLVAVVISVAPLSIAKDPNFDTRLEVEKRCMISQNVAYQMIATIATFYGPLVFILLLYWRIYQVARKRIRRKPGARIVLQVQKNSNHANNLSVPCQVELTTATNFSTDISTNTTLTTTTSNPHSDRSATGLGRLCVASGGIGVGGGSGGGGTGSQVSYTNGVDESGRFYDTPVKNVSTCLTINESGLTSSQVASREDSSSDRSVTIKEPPVSSTTTVTTVTTTANETPKLCVQEMHGSKCEISDVCESSNGDMDDEWDLIGPEVSNTSDAISATGVSTANSMTTPCTNRKRNKGDGVGGSGGGGGGGGGENDNRKSKAKKVIKLTGNLLSSSRKNYGTCCSSGSSTPSVRESIESKRERKAAKTLAIITGIFVICWLPFFIIAVAVPLCGDACTPPVVITDLFLWLGYVNSMLNPVIYTIFSADFRTAFKKILLGRQAIQRSCRV
ncbi:5-hydroxytryptamine receptor-like [Brevipalpus obovatus]|uniref:5-hydroxytryptamine receptor-like n=1 Tax=Brevipalpus obovatus TaxID=246614 RepID=UPI003D9ED541